MNTTRNSSRGRKDIEWALTEDDGVARRPAGNVREHAYTIKHDADGERIVRCAGTRQGAIKMCAHQYDIVISLGGTRHAYDDVGEVGVCLLPIMSNLGNNRPVTNEMSRYVRNAPMTDAAWLMSYLAL